VVIELLCLLTGQQKEEFEQTGNDDIPEVHSWTHEGKGAFHILASCLFTLNHVEAFFFSTCIFLLRCKADFFFQAVDLHKKGKETKQPVYRRLIHTPLDVENIQEVHQ